MSFLTKEQARAPKRRTQELKLHEYDAPLLVAEMSASLGFRLRERKMDFSSEEAMTSLISDMLVTEDGARMFSVDEATDFLAGLSLVSATALLKACTASVQLPAGGGDSGNPVPSSSAS